MAAHGDRHSSCRRFSGNGTGTACRGGATGRRRRARGSRVFDRRAAETAIWAAGKPTAALGSGGQGGGRPCGTCGASGRARGGSAHAQLRRGAGPRAAWRRLALGTHAMAAWRRRRTATGRGAGDWAQVGPHGPGPLAVVGAQFLVMSGLERLWPKRKLGFKLTRILF